jgi:hypothetical protein
MALGRILGTLLGGLLLGIVTSAIPIPILAGLLILFSDQSLGTPLVVPDHVKTLVVPDHVKTTVPPGA